MRVASVPAFNVQHQRPQLFCGKPFARASLVNAAKPLFSCARRGSAESVGPPPTSVGQQPAEVSSLPAGPALRREPKQQPTRADEELLEVRLELLEPRLALEEVGSGRTVAGYAQQDAVSGRAAPDLQLFVVTREGPHLLSHGRGYRLQQRRRLARQRTFLNRAARPGASARRANPN